MQFARIRVTANYRALNGMHSRKLQKMFTFIGDVRGLGLMVATEFTSDGKPDKEIAISIQTACLARNLLLLTCGTYGNVIRWIPPLIVTEEQVDDALNIFTRALEEVNR